VTYKLIINSNSSETRVAALEDDTLTEINIERSSSQGIVGNIYKAKVIRVLPGMQSAFIDIGGDRAAFLYGGDVIDFNVLKSAQSQGQPIDNDNEFQNFREMITGTPIEKLLQPGMEIVVQIIKDPIGTKGARASMFLSIPGRYLVMMPDFFHIGISRRIEDATLRQNLLEQVTKIKPDDAGFIIRTAAQEATEVLLQDDIEYLLRLNRELRKRRSEMASPCLLYKEPPIHVKITRDMYSSAVNEVIVDNAAVYSDLKLFVDEWVPEASKKIALYTGDKPIFDEYGIEMDIAKALGKKVWLPSGGYLIIEQTEALTSFDVNTGRFVGKVSAKDTIRKTNLEAVDEVVSQLKLRNIGGIIVIDLIDMETQEDRSLVVERLQELLKTDKARSNVLQISELGLIEMTRKRTNESLERKLTVDCPHCNGTGKIKSNQTDALDLIRDIQRHHLRTHATEIKVQTRKQLRDWVIEHEKVLFEEVCRKWDLSISFITDDMTVEMLSGPAYEIS
jgi:ribonuclease G